MNSSIPGALECLADETAVARRAADEILTAAERAVSARGRFRIVLAGGSSPLAAYRLLAQERSRWDAWEVYFGDERCLAPDDPQRNSRAAREALLDAVPVDPRRVFPIPAELGAEAGAAAYAPRVEAALPFDLVLLGMGEDGHTASLFPGHPVPSNALTVAVHQAPKPPPDRISLTPRALASSDCMLVLVTGVSKRAALAAWRGGEDLPIARVTKAGRALVLVDRPAMGS